MKLKPYIYAMLPVASLGLTACHGTSSSQTSGSPEVFVTPDLAFFDLKGHVKRVIIDMTKTAEFDADGRLTRYCQHSDILDDEGNYEGILDYGYSYDGEYITTTVDPVTMTNYTWEEGRLASRRDDLLDYGLTTILYQYDEQGHVCAMEVDESFYSEAIFVGAEEDAGATAHRLIRCSYPSFDSHGNWIEQKQDCDDDAYDYVLERTIEYYD